MQINSEITSEFQAWRDSIFGCMIGFGWCEHWRSHFLRYWCGVRKKVRTPQGLRGTLAIFMVPLPLPPPSVMWPSYHGCNHCSIMGGTRRYQDQAPKGGNPFFPGHLLSRRLQTPKNRIRFPRPWVFGGNFSWSPFFQRGPSLFWETHLLGPRN